MSISGAATGQGSKINRMNGESGSKDLGITSVPFLYTYAAIFSWGMWGFLTKFASRDLSASGLKVWVFFGQSLAALIVFAVIRFQLKWDRVGTICALLCGFIGSMGDLTLYAAFRRGGPSSILIPFTALAPIVTIGLAIPLLAERLRWREWCAVALAVVAGVLLST